MTDTSAPLSPDAAAAPAAVAPPATPHLDAVKALDVSNPYAAQMYRATHENAIRAERRAMAAHAAPVPPVAPVAPVANGAPPEAIAHLAAWQELKRSNPIRAALYFNTYGSAILAAQRAGRQG